jgi:hypothetical protein
MVNKELQNGNFWYINFNIKKYIKIDDIIDIINLIDDKMIGNDKIYGTNIIVKIIKSTNTEYDYICKTNLECGDEIVEDFLSFKFKQVQNLIKFNNSQFGFDWEINFELV